MSRSAPICEKAFVVTEIWHLVIGFVDDKDVFRLQQVCHLFNDRINNNSLCQQRLFLQPENPTIDNSKNRKGSLKTNALNLKLNPFLAQISVPPFIDWIDFAKKHENSNPRPRVPLMQAWDVGNNHICIYPVRECRSESQLNKMFVTQPPITAVSLVVPGATSWKHHASQYPKDVTVYNPAGLTIGDILRELRGISRSNDYAAGSPLMIVVHAWASYERFYSAYRTVLAQSNKVFSRSISSER